jgi:Zn-dependent protease with chaperone function
MIIGHELGHIKAGHLQWRWVIAPALLVPFLAGALSGAGEFTCDRYGMVGAGQREGAELGLIVLAAGGHLAPQVNRTAFDAAGCATGSAATAREPRPRESALIPRYR